MRKFLLPIINLVNIILVSIAWGLSGKTAVLEKVNHQSTPKGNNKLLQLRTKWLKKVDKLTL